MTRRRKVLLNNSFPDVISERVSGSFHLVLRALQSDPGQNGVSFNNVGAHGLSRCSLTRALLHNLVPWVPTSVVSQVISFRRPPPIPGSFHPRFSKQGFI